jgi:hypothetical protein
MDATVTVNISECEHELEHCPCCDTVRCKKCGKVWGGETKRLDYPDPQPYIGKETWPQRWEWGWPGPNSTGGSRSMSGESWLRRLGNGIR